MNNARAVLITFLISLSMTILQGQSEKMIACNTWFYMHYEANSVHKPIDNKYLIYFEDLFNQDTIQIYLNDSLLCQKVLTTDPSLGVSSSIRFPVDFSCYNVLRIEDVSKKECLEFILDPRYRILYVDFTENTWGVTFSNDIRIYE